MPTKHFVVGQVELDKSIQTAIFQQLLDAGHPPLLQPYQAVSVVTRQPAKPGRFQAAVALRLKKKGLRPIKLGGRWLFPLAEVARWLAAGCAGAQVEPQKRPGSNRSPGRPRKGAGGAP